MTAAHCVYYKHENQNNKQLYSEIIASFNAHSQDDGTGYPIPEEDVHPHFLYCFIASTLISLFLKFFSACHFLSNIFSEPFELIQRHSTSKNKRKRRYVDENTIWNDISRQHPCFKL